MRAVALGQPSLYLINGRNAITRSKIAYIMYPNQNKGIGAGVLSGVFWGTPFLAPLILTMFSSIEVAFGRFVFFGLISLLALPGIIRLIRNLSYTDIAIVIALSATGFWLYTIILFYGVKLTNGVISALIVGILPVTVTLLSNPRFNKGLGLGLLLILLGIGALLIVPLMNPHIFAITMAHVHASGLILLFLALGMWTWFALANSWFLKKHSYIKSLDYSSLMGVISLLCMLPIFMMRYSIHNITSNPHFTLFIIWSAILGLGASHR